MDAPFLGSTGVSGVLANSRDLDELRDLLIVVAALVGRVNPGILEGDFCGEFVVAVPFRSCGSAFDGTKEAVVMDDVDIYDGDDDKSNRKESESVLNSKLTW